MSDKISLTASMRSTLLNLQNISKKVSLTQNILSTGKKVNSALDNPSSFYTATSLKNRAGDLNVLLDSMEQAIQTIQAASTSLETGASFLEQATAVAVQAIEKGNSSQIQNNALLISDADDKINTTNIALATSENVLEVANMSLSEDFSDYQKITTETTEAEIQAMMTAGSKIILETDVVLSSSLTITAKDIIINGNGHKITFNPSSSNKAAILINGGSVDIKNLNIEATGTKVYGIQVTNGGSLTIDNTQGITVNGTGAKKLANGDVEIFDGKSNTIAFVNDPNIGNKALATTAVTQYYPPEVSKDNSIFGAGKWYLPAFGELLQTYGYNPDNITAAFGNTGVTDNLSIINASLEKAGGDAFTSGFYQSSTEYNQYDVWEFGMSDGSRGDVGGEGKTKVSYCVRAYLQIDGLYNPLSDTLNNAPQIGDIVYDDKTWSSATEYNSSKNAIGVVTSVSADKSDVTITALKDLTFSAAYGGTFDPNNPYNNTSPTTSFLTSSLDAIGVENYDSEAKMLTAIKSGGSITVKNQPFTLPEPEPEPDPEPDPEPPVIPNPPMDSEDDTNSNKTFIAQINSQYNRIINQFDDLIKDSSYKGINLLKNENLSVRFNEDNSSSFNVVGKDMSSAGLGLITKDWLSTSDVATSLKEISAALNSIRSFKTDLGNNYSIIQTRQDFTENLINILTEGADKLTLADMNEESAKMLSLQTRQQLAVNALSLVNQSNKAILQMF